MTDKLDDVLDSAIRAEKAQALEKFRMHPLSIPRTDTAAASRMWPVLLRNFALSGVALAVLVLGVILFVPARQQRKRIEVATIQRALQTADSGQTTPASVAPVPSYAFQNRHVALRENGSDMTWTVQRAIVRTQSLDYHERDLNRTVLAALSKVQHAEIESAPSGHASSTELPAKLDDGLDRLVSASTIERALRSADRKAHSSHRLTQLK